MTLGFNPFVRRQTPESKFTSWTLSDEEILQRVRNAWGTRRAGYRDGVVLVPVDPTGFFTGLVELQEGDSLRGSFMPRQPGEEPRISICLDPGVPGPSLRDRKAPAKHVDVVLYSRETLAEDGETPAFDWNIVSVNGNPCEGPMPIEPFTLMANHFHVSGGTATGMTPEQFEAALKESFLFWRDKTFIG